MRDNPEVRDEIWERSGKTKRRYTGRIEKGYYEELPRGRFGSNKRTQQGPGLKLVNKFLRLYNVIRNSRNDKYMVEKIGGDEGPSQTSTAADHVKQ